jgi:hypothetical protein
VIAMRKPTYGKLKEIRPRVNVLLARKRSISVFLPGMLMPHGAESRLRVRLR